MQVIAISQTRCCSVTTVLRECRRRDEGYILIVHCTQSALVIIRGFVHKLVSTYCSTCVLYGRDTAVTVTHGVQQLCDELLGYDLTLVWLHYNPTKAIEESVPLGKIRSIIKNKNIVNLGTHNSSSPHKVEIKLLIWCKKMFFSKFVIARTLKYYTFAFLQYRFLCGKNYIEEFDCT